MAEGLSVDGSQRVGDRNFEAAVECFVGEPGDVRRRDNIVELEQRVCAGGRFGIKHVQTGAFQMS